MTVTIATETVGERERVDYCRNALRELLDTDCRIEPHPAAPFDMRLTLHRLGALKLVEASGSPLHAVSAAGGGEAIVVLVRDGRGVVRQAGREAGLAAGVMCLVDGDESAEFRLGERYRHLALRVPRQRLDVDFPDWRSLAVTGIPLGCGPAAVFADSLAAILKYCGTLAPADLKGVSDALLSLLVTMLATCSRYDHVDASRVEHYHLERVKSFARARLSDPELDVKMIADGVGLSPSYIHRLFARGPMRLMQWVCAERLDACHRELSSPAGPKRPIYLVAHDWGFNDQAHFSRAFKARFGLSPTAVRAGQPPCMCGAAECSAAPSETNTGSLSDKCCFRTRC